MAKSLHLKELAAQLAESLPQHLGILKKDLEKNIHASLKQVFDQLNLVTKEEFDTQSEVLARARKKIDELEKKLTKIEDLLSKRRV